MPIEIVLTSTIMTAYFLFILSSCRINYIEVTYEEMEKRLCNIIDCYQKTKLVC